HPEERLIGWSSVWLFDVADEPVGVVFTARESGLDGTRLAQNFRSHVAIFQVKGGIMFGEILVGLGLAGLEKGNLQSSFCKAFAGPSAGSAGTNNNDIEKMVLSLGHAVLAEKNGC